MRINQAKLAEYAEISLPHLVAIEYCKTWVSDKTLEKLARALNMEVFELLTPEGAETKRETGADVPSLRSTVGLINTKKTQMRKKVGEMMDELVKDIVKLYGEEE
jgi:transcriptional regulator with XRE-family HTH domain